MICATIVNTVNTFVQKWLKIKSKIINTLHT